MEAFEDSSRLFVARGRVEMARTDFSARCGEAVYYLRGDRIIFRKKPVLWHGENQISGDSIVVTTSERRIQRVVVNGHAMAISRADTARRMRFNQLSARTVTMRFERGKIAEINAERTATSLYYLFDGTDPNGLNHSSGDRIIMLFDANAMTSFTIVGGVEGRYYPERMIARREYEYNLDGFSWIPDRPKRRELTMIYEGNE
jgi:hypothetical protein